MKNIVTAGFILLIGFSGNLFSQDGVSFSENDAKTDQELFDAASAGNADLVISLLESGANVNARDGGEDWEATTLMRASSNGHVEVVQILLDRGANATLSDGMMGLELFMRPLINIRRLSAFCWKPAQIRMRAQ